MWPFEPSQYLTMVVIYSSLSDLFEKIIHHIGSKSLMTCIIIFLYIHLLRSSFNKRTITQVPSHYINNFYQLTVIIQIMNEFDFPDEIESLSQCFQINQLKQKLSQMQRCISYKFRLKYIHHKLKYIYIQCRSCTWHLRYRYNNQNKKYVLYKQSRSHNHLQQKKIRINSIETYLLSLPLGIKPCYAKKIATQTLKISDSSFYYYFNKVHRVNLPISLMFREMDEHQYNIFTEPFDLKPIINPDLTIIITPKMKQNFEKFGRGQPVCMDTTFNMIKDSHPSGQQFKLGFIVGTSYSSKIIPFCMFITIDQTKERYLSIIRTFLTVMEAEPSVFITDEALSIKFAFKQLIDEGIYSGLHALDIFHILRNLRAKLKQKQKLKDFAELARSENAKEFQWNLSNLVQDLDEDDLPHLKRFVHQSSSYSISQVQKCFVGFSISDSIVQKTHDLAKNLIPISKNYTYVAKKICQFLEQLGSKGLHFSIQSTKFQQIYDLPQLKQIRFSLDKRLFQRFLVQFRKAIYHQFVQQEDNIVEILQTDNISFTVLKDRNNDWGCECQYGVKTGLICSHLIKLCIKLDIKMINYIHKRWILPEFHVSRKRQVSRGRLTRRNHWK